MAASEGALARWRAHLEEVLGVEDAARVVDPFTTVDWGGLATDADLARLGARMDGLGARMDGLGARMDGLETRMDGLETRMDGLETRMDGLETRMDGLETRMDGLETRMDGLETRMDRLDARMDQLQRDMHRGFDSIRRDLLKVTGAQFFALVAAVAAALGLG